MISEKNLELQTNFNEQATATYKKISTTKDIWYQQLGTLNYHSAHNRKCSETKESKRPTLFFTSYTVLLF